MHVHSHAGCSAACDFLRGLPSRLEHAGQGTPAAQTMHTKGTRTPPPTHTHHRHHHRLQIHALRLARRVRLVVRALSSSCVYGQCSAFSLQATSKRMQSKQMPSKRIATASTTQLHGTHSKRAATSYTNDITLQNSDYTKTARQQDDALLAATSQNLRAARNAYTLC